jgi:hypothetical protein
MHLAEISVIHSWPACGATIVQARAMPVRLIAARRYLATV